MFPKPGEQNILRIYDIMNSQCLKIPEMKNLFESTNLLILISKDAFESSINGKEVSQGHFKKDIISPIPSIVVYNFYKDDKGDPSFFIFVVKKFICIVEFNQLQNENVKNYFFQIFSSFEQTTFIPILEEDKKQFNDFFTLNKTQNLSELYKDNSEIIQKYEKELQKNYPQFKWKEEKICIEKFILISYKVRLIYCINRYYYANEDPKLNFYHHKFSFNSDLHIKSFLKIRTIDNLSYFYINKKDFSPCYFHYTANEDQKMSLLDVVEFHRNFHFYSILPCYGYIKSEDCFVYKYLKNKKKFKDLLTDEIKSAFIFRISSAILFLHSHNYIFTQFSSDDIFFDNNNRIYLGVFRSNIKKNDSNNSSSKEENGIDHFKKYVYDLFDESKRSSIKELIDGCNNIRDIFTIIIKNNIFYDGENISELKTLIFDKKSITNNSNNNPLSFGDFKNCINSLQKSKELTLFSRGKLDNFELMNIQIFKLKNRILDEYFVREFKERVKDKKFAVFGYNEKRNYLCICIEKNYFLINSSFLLSLTEILKELCNLILVPISLDAKKKFLDTIKIDNSDNESRLSFTFINNKDIQDIETSINTISQICKFSLIKMKKQEASDILDKSYSQCIQVINDYTKFVEPDEYLPTLLGYFIQRNYFNSKYFQDYSFFKRKEIIKKYSKKLSINDFQILKLIGSGASSRVYLAVHIETLVFVVLKFYDINKNDMFHRDKSFLEKTQGCPYIIEYYGSFVSKENKNVILLDFKTNGDISKCLKYNQSVDLFHYWPKELSENDLNMKIILNILFALHYLHYELRCIHQDLSPSNIMVDHDFNIFLTDFESSTSLDSNNFNEDSFKNDLWLFGKIIYYICEKNDNQNNIFDKNVSFYQLTNQNLKIISFILRQCAKNSLNSYGSTLLFIYEIQFFGYLFPGNNKDMFIEIFKQNLQFIKNACNFRDNIIFQRHSSIDNKKLVSIFYYLQEEEKKKGNRIPFISYLLGTCFKNGLIVKQDHQIALDYFNCKHIDNDNQDLYEIMSIYSDKNNPFINFNEVDNIYNKIYSFNQNQSFKIKYRMGISFLKRNDQKKNDSRALQLFEEAINMIEEKNKYQNYYFLSCSYHIGKLYSKRDKDKSFQSFHNLVENLQFNDLSKKSLKFRILVSKIYYHYSLHLIQKKDNPKVFLKNAFKLNPDNCKIVRLFNTSNLIELKEVFNSNYYSLSGETNEFYGDICYANNDEKRSIYYYSIASKLGELTASLKLGMIYFESCCNNDILKSIYYFSKILKYKIENDDKRSAYLNDYKLISIRFLIKIKIKYGCIDVEEIKKSKYFSIDLRAGTIEELDNDFYYEISVKFFKQKTPKFFIISLLCLNIAAKLYHFQAKYDIGKIYYEGKYVIKDTKKAIEYLIPLVNTNNKNCSNAQLILGNIYSDNKCDFFDINKAMHFFTQAASEYIFQLTENKYLEELLKKFSFYFLSSINQINLIEKEDLQLSTEPKIIIINEYAKDNDKYFIICFDYKLFVVNRKGKDESYISLNDFFAKSDLSLLKISILNEENESFSYEVKEFLKQFRIIDSDSQDFWKIIVNCLCAFLIKKGHQNSKKLFDEYLNKGNIEYHENCNDLDQKCIKLRYLGRGSGEKTDLIYFIPKEVIFVLKSFNSEDCTFNERYMDFYSNIKYPYICQYYGYIESNHNKNLLFEYVEGQALNKYDLSKLSNQEKYNIIFELLLTIRFIYSKQCIYRDIKLENIIINSNKDAILINFDQITRQSNETYESKSGMSEERKIIKSDINFLVDMIFYIFGSFTSISNNLNNNNDSKLSISELIHEFYVKYSLHIQSKSAKEQNLVALFEKDSLEKNKYEMFTLGLIYYEDKYISRDINKAVHYYSLAANHNYSKAQYSLGLIYYNGLYINRDIYKAIHYFSLAANQNDSYSQCILGLIYYQDVYIPHDISRAIHYFSLAANQNNSIAQYNLGNIYYEGKYVPRDINKAIHFFTLAANQNNIKAQFNLGNIYFEGKYVQIDIPKAILYLTNAADQFHSQAPFILGSFYYEGVYVEYNIEKAIHYFNKASLISDQYANNNLGVIYKTGKGVKANINKAIEYFGKAINEKQDEVAMFNLAHIYFFEEAGISDPQKAIELLVKPSLNNVPYALDLCCLVIIKKYSLLDNSTIIAEFENIDKKIGAWLSQLIIDKIQNYKSNGTNWIDNLCKKLIDINLVYYENKVGNQGLKKRIEIVSN